MPRSLRLEFPGAFYHVMARGNRRESIFHDAENRRIRSAEAGPRGAALETEDGLETISFTPSPKWVLVRFPLSVGTTPIDKRH